MSLFRNPPDTKFADTGSGRVGYQVFGSGDRNVVFRSAVDSNADAMWDQPSVGSYFDRLAALGRVLYFDWRGSGISDPLPPGDGITWDAYNDDLIAAMDAAEMDRATIVGDREGGPSVLLFAATYPERVDALVLVNTFARFLRADDYPIGAPVDVLDKVMEFARAAWGTPEYYLATAPSIRNDRRLLRWLARYQRMAAPPSAIDFIQSFHAGIDVRSVLSQIQAPTLVITRREATYHRPEFGRHIAEHIPGAEIVELPGADTAPFFVGDIDAVLDAIEKFVAGSKVTGVTDRVLATVMFTDIVDSTRLAAELGDDGWLDLLEGHNRIADRVVRQHRGRIVKTTGDGVLATFDGTTRAMSCATELEREISHIGMGIRVGVHTGEIELQPDGDIGGLAVHIAARVMGTLSGPGVVASSTVHDLLAGSHINFISMGEQPLKGVPGTWHLYHIDAQ